MNIKVVFWGLVIFTAVIFAIIYALAGNNALMTLSLGLGAAWLVADAKITNGVGTPFFVAFAVLAVIASLNDAAVLATILGLSTDLAAWDLTRFRMRFRAETTGKRRAVAETRHLRLLVAAVGSGVVLALLPVYVHLTISFLLICVVTLLALLALHQSMRSLRSDRDSYNQGMHH